jgi:tRNA splicing ligase
MASSSTQNISGALPEGDDLDTAVNRALYYEPVVYALKKYSSFNITEETIARTVKKCIGDGELYTDLLIEHRKALSTLGISDIYIISLSLTLPFL